MSEAVQGYLPVWAVGLEIAEEDPVAAVAVAEGSIQDSSLLAGSAAFASFQGMAAAVAVLAAAVAVS